MGDAGIYFDYSPKQSISKIEVLIFKLEMPPKIGNPKNLPRMRKTLHLNFPWIWVSPLLTPHDS